MSKMRAKVKTDQVTFHVINIFFLLPSTEIQIVATIQPLPEYQHGKENERWKHAFKKTLCLEAMDRQEPPQLSARHRITFFMDLRHYAPEDEG